MFKRTQKGVPWSKQCGNEIETMEHVLLNCPKAEEIWKFTPIKWDVWKGKNGISGNGGKE